MKKFFCFGKKGFCDDERKCNDCGFVDKTGGEYREVLKTNADHIRAMSDEELAVFLYEWSPSEFCCHICPRLSGDMPCKGKCFESRKEWLQQPYKGLDHA